MGRGVLGTGPTLATLGDVLPGGHSPELRGPQTPPKPSWRKSFRRWLSPLVCSCLSPASVGRLCPGGDSDRAEGTPHHAPGGWVPSAPRVRSSSKLVPLLPHAAREQSLARCGDTQSRGQVSRSSKTPPAHRPAPRVQPVGWGGFGEAQGPPASAPRETHGDKAYVPRGPGKPSSSGGTSTDALRRSKTPVTAPHPGGLEGGWET